MQIKKFLAPSVLPFALCALFGLAACDSGSSNNNPVDPNQGVIDPNQGVTDPNQGVTDPNQGTAVAYPALATGANAAYAQVVYSTWKPFHYVNMEDEGLYYADFAPEFGYVFANYQPAGRVIWSTQSSGAYKYQCQNENASGTMKYRACTVSEGIGYGMLLTYVNGDRDAFIRLWNYSRAFRAYHNVNLTPWITKSFMYDEIDVSSATDADLDIATSLILQYYRTLAIDPASAAIFLQDAMVIANAIWEQEVEPNALLLMSGDTQMWHSADPTYNLSYFSPVALRLFAMFDKTHNWTGVLDNMYAYMAKVQAAGTGVFPDWSNSAGIAVNPPNGAAGNSAATYTWHTFNKESVRIPWRIAWDYYWNQSAEAQTILTKMSTFISTATAGDPNALSDYSYNYLTGELSTSSIKGTHFIGAYCLMGMGVNQPWLDACYARFNNEMAGYNPVGYTGTYFKEILMNLFATLLNGGFVK